jgi:hypothetical protein
VHVDYEKTGPLRARFEFVGAGPDHLPEGNYCRCSIAIWEDGQPVIDSERRQYAEHEESDNSESRMPAMQTPQTACGGIDSIQTC